MPTRLIFAAGVVLASVVVGAADARAQSSGAAVPGGEYRPVARGARVMLNLRDADLMTLVRAVSALTGRRFIIGRVHEFRATIYAPRPVSVAEAYEAFVAALEANGLTVVPAGRYQRIVERAEMARQPVPVVTSSAQPPTGGGAVLSRVVHRFDPDQRLERAEQAAALLRRVGSRGSDVTVVPPPAR